MIATLTMNPAIDRTVVIPRLVVGGLNRIKTVRNDGSGKGINVARVLAEFAEPSIVLGLFAGAEGRYLVNGLPDKIKAKATWLDKGSTRINLKVFSEETQQITELNEPGPPVTKSDLERLLQDILCAVTDCDFLVLAGSLPPNVPTDIYYQIINQVQARGVRCVLDASGEALAKGILAKPFMIKPNDLEAEQLLGSKLDTIDSKLEAVGKLVAQGIQIVGLSLGAEGVIFGRDDQYYLASARAPLVHSTVGCGDTLVAASVYGLYRGYTFLETIRFAVAAATATVGLAGTTFPSLELVESLLDLVSIRKL